MVVNATDALKVVMMSPHLRAARRRGSDTTVGVRPETPLTGDGGHVTVSTLTTRADHLVEEIAAIRITDDDHG
jgi:hypothetical protein